MKRNTKKGLLSSKTAGGKREKERERERERRRDQDMAEITAMPPYFASLIFQGCPQ
jgi:hypothetical protein